MTYTYPASPSHTDSCCADPTCRTSEEWVGTVADDLDATGHSQIAAQLRAATSAEDFADAAAHLDAIAGTVANPDLYDRLRAHVRMMRGLAGADVWSGRRA